MQLPSRRSDAEFQEILDTFVGDKQTVLTGNLPDLLAAYERDHDTKILDELDFLGVKQLCEQYPDLQLGPVDLFGFLGAVVKRTPTDRPASPPSPTPGAGLPHSSSMPPSSFHDYDQSTPQQPPRRRRHNSDRVRSPSDSSSSNSSGEEDEIAQRRRQQRQTSAPPQRAKAFPKSSTANVPPTQPTGWLPMRKKTLSDPNRSDGSLGSPLAARVRAAAGPPSAFGGFARPSPASRRARKVSSGSASAHQSYEDDRKSPEPQNQPTSRSTSSSSVGMTSPPAWQTRYDSRPTPPMSPSDEVDNTSFHARAKSPETDGGGSEVDQVERDDLGSEHGYNDEDERNGYDGEEIDVMGQEMTKGSDSLDARLSRFSTESTTSLRTSHDNLSKLRKENTELARKLRETEKTLAVQGAENERLIVDLQVRLDEVQSEIAQRRKEEKELKGKDRAQLIQISGFEADILSLQRSLENAKANHASMQKMYNSQCEEAQRLRDLLRDRDEEIRQLEETTQAHAADEERFTREVAALEAEVKRIETDLNVARQAESHLDVQKQENLQLKETIDRMRFDLEEARVAAANAVGGSHQRGTSAAGSSTAGTLSRNLGDELNRRLMHVEKVEQEGHDSEGESFVETIVTTQRTRKVGGRSPQPRTTTTQPESQAPASTSDIEEVIREYADASTETEAEAGPSHHHIPLQPPAYTAEPEPVNASAVLGRAHPREAGHEGVADEEYDVLVDALGVRCTVLEEELKIKKVEREKRGIITSPSRARTYWSQQRKQYQSGIVNYIFTTTDSSMRDQVGKFAMLTVAAFAVGLVAGSHIYSHPAGIHPRDYHLFQQMNTLAGAAGVGEGFLPMSMLGVVEQGARMVAGVGRIPS
ncbi:hypothetical protein CI109_106079 [Kwoniella shandongensis]|uniref:Uncharacterized protein n=1 Tax=Kwoniella shandongensis TaxID=1734106 RepID=A0A5M6BTI1_9TREE|nr:uncharacterized protein CI109_006383 [Kwoniella shandongensis]KAA5525312.1 hypothetical protein CI109_006383 [Kwoniella shandongensis]